MYHYITVLFLIIVASGITYLFNYAKVNRFLVQSWKIDTFLVEKWGYKLPAYDKMVHFIECAIFVRILRLAFPQYTWFCFAFVMAFMLAYEIWQHSKPAGQFSFKDIIANIVGGLWGMV